VVLATTVVLVEVDEVEVDEVEEVDDVEVDELEEVDDVEVDEVEEVEEVDDVEVEEVDVDVEAVPPWKLMWWAAVGMSDSVTILAKITHWVTRQLTVWPAGVTKAVLTTKGTGTV
jgi:hypothetical protein